MSPWKTAGDLASRLAAGPTLSLGHAKRLYRRSLVSDMATVFAEETAIAMLSGTADRAEGTAAPMEGRRPKFTGRLSLTDRRDSPCQFRLFRLNDVNEGHSSPARQAPVPVVAAIALLWI